VIFAASTTAAASSVMFPFFLEFLIDSIKKSNEYLILIQKGRESSSINYSQNSRGVARGQG